MENKLLTFGFILLATGGVLGIIFCAIALLHPLSFPATLIVLSFIFIIGGFIVIATDGNNDTKRLQKMNEELELLTMTFHIVQKKNILNKILATRLLSAARRIIPGEAGL